MKALLSGETPSSTTDLKDKENEKKVIFIIIWLLKKQIMILDLMTYDAFIFYFLDQWRNERTRNWSIHPGIGYYWSARVVRDHNFNQLIYNYKIETYTRFGIDHFLQGR